MFVNSDSYETKFLISKLGNLFVILLRTTINIPIYASRLLYGLSCFECRLKTEHTCNRDPDISAHMYCLHTTQHHL